MTIKQKSLVYVIQAKNGDILGWATNKIDALKLLSLYLKRHPDKDAKMITTMR